ncbi:MAG: L-threonylcarbamoyladenylate synthase [Bryobacteraceae bacterium]
MITIAEAAERIRSGELVALPTETVYGLGANALDAAAVAKIYALKRRPATSPLIVHVDSVEMAKSLVREWPEEADRLARKYWPGPLTLVLPKAAAVPDIVSAGLPTVGIRMPKHPMALELIRLAGVPIAAPSANKFTGLSPTSAQHVREAFGDAVPVIDGGPCEVGIESTVVAIESGRIHLLRPGMISLMDVERASAPDEGAAHPAPGMHERHYSPRTRLLLISDPSQLPDHRGAYLWRTNTGPAARLVRMPSDPTAYAARLYGALHELDREDWPWIAVEMPPKTSEWEAVLDRLRRAATK